MWTVIFLVIAFLLGLFFAAWRLTGNPLTGIGKIIQSFFICIALAAFLGALGCASDPSIRRTALTDEAGMLVLDPKGNPYILEQRISAEDAFYTAQAEIQKARKPLFVMEAIEGQTISLTGVKRFEVWAPDGQGGRLQTYEHPHSKNIGRAINGFMGLGQIVAGAWGINEIVKSAVGSAGHNTNTAYTGSFNASGQGSGVVMGSGTVSPTVDANKPITTTDRHDVNDSYNATDNHATTP